MPNINDTPDPDRMVLGEGRLAWPAIERQTDRYGTVCLFADGHRDPVSFADAPVGTHGRLVATVLIARTSRHVGDRAQESAATAPAVGEEITLGTGTLFVADTAHAPASAIGLRPDERRSTGWLNVQALHHAQDQTVRLWLYPDKQRW